MASLTSRHSALSARIGLARVDITPPIGVYARNWGAARHDMATSIHRPLTLTALTISSLTDSQQPPLVLLDADLGWWKTPQVFTRVQSSLLAAAGHTDAYRLAFALSHTHAGPPLMEPDDSLPGSHLIGPWLEMMISRAQAAIGSALATADEAVLEWHTGHCNLAAYRDLPDPDPAKSRIVCGYNPVGTADDTLVVGRICDRSGRVLATLANYACHPTTLAWDNTAISPDFIGAMRETMQQATGAPALFLQGASGELSPREQYVGDTAIADRHGRQLAYAALATLEDMEQPGHELAYERTVESGAPLAVWAPRPIQSCTTVSAIPAMVQLPLKDWPSADELEQQRIASTDRALEERLRRKRDIRRALGDGQTYALPIMAWRLGDAAIVGSCCEAYSVFQSELRERFAGRTIICMNLVNGSMGYLPPQALYDQDLYQV
ncbi:MAG: alkaline ceramidase, partial [Pirellulaceae bacterium]|nr:alkaline ceramidase [Pirellulaceae bacterium]